MSAAQPHRWVFSRIGGFDQALLQTADDLLHLGELDQKLWAALSCPVKGLQFDERTLAMIDLDKDGRVRVPEVVAAVTWATKVLKDPGLLLNPADQIPLAAFNEQTPEGAAVLASAKALLATLGKADSDVIALVDTQDQTLLLTKALFNGDGVVQPEATDDTALRAVIADLLATQTPVVDASGAQGFDKALLEQFFAALKARQTWLQAADAGAQPLGDQSAAAYGALQRVRAKIDDFFSRGRLAQYDARALELLNKSLSTIEGLGDKDLSAQCAEIENLPLAQLNPENSLPLMKGVNPAWQVSVEDFRRHLVAPLLGAAIDSLSYEQWQSIKLAFAGYETWLAAEQGQSVASLSAERIAHILDSASYTQLLALIEQDLALAPQVQAFYDVARILHFRLHLKRLLNNFVNFTEFYGAVGQAIFQAGTLYLDGRACELCIRVDDASKHAALAGLSKCFLAYCDCTRPNGDKLAIVAAFTAGDSDYLLVGRNGVFYDRLGRDWDATITKLIENPISISQAFFAPYKRLIRFVEEQAAKTATAADAASDELLAKTAVPIDPAKAVTTPVAVPAPAAPKFDVGIVAALGVAVGGITTALGMLLQAFFGLGWLMPLGLVGLVLVISGPSMFIAWLKLRQRNLGPILDATGWAVNGHIKINLPFGGKLTQQGRLPAGASRSLVDPYQEAATPWGKIISLTLVALVVVAVVLCKLEGKKWPWEYHAPVVTPAAVEPPAPKAKT